MLAYILALIVGSGGFALYMAAFFFPEVHRKNDFVWSGVGLFYALVLWVCAERITGGVLLGQTASVALIGWLGWQTFLLRRQVAPLDQQTPLPTVDEVKASLTGLTSAEGRAGAAGQASRLLNQVKQGVQGAVSGITSLKRSPAESEIYVPPSVEEFGTAGQDAIARFAKVAIPEPETVTSSPSSLSEVENAIREPLAKLSTGIPTAVANGAEQITVENLADATAVASEAAAAVTASAQTMKNAIAPVPKQVPKPVTEQAVETAVEKGKGLGGLFQGLNPKNQKKESKPVYVRKQFREESATPPAKTGKKPSPKENPRKESKPASKPVYVRKQFRDESAPEPKEIKEAIAEINDAEVKASVTSSADLPAAIASTSETISEAVVSELLGNAPVETSAAEIVEDLLEDISVQEGTLVIEATEFIEVAIESNDGLMEPLTWVVELENDTATKPLLPKRAVDNSEHLH